jgi:hypothetical protein
MAILADVTQDALDVGPGLAVGRHAPIAVDRALAGVVAGGRERDVALEIGQQPAQVGEAAADVLLGVVGLADVEALGGVGDQLHDAHRVLGRERLRVERRLGEPDRERELGRMPYLGASSASMRATAWRAAGRRAISASTGQRCTIWLEGVCRQSGTRRCIPRCSAACARVLVALGAAMAKSVPA